MSEVVDRSQTGIVFNIQKFSVNDGPGIRTVVFLKGCPLHCRWCANPESQSTKVQVMWDHKKCLTCRHCESVCENDAIHFINGKIHIDHMKCNACKKCVEECPGHALETEGESKTIEEVMNVVRQDFDFYEESNGGMTISGGELFAQPSYARNLFLAAHEDHIHTCCETTGFTSLETFKSVIEPIDSILMDLKHYDSRKHAEYTGVGNEQIIENMKYAIAIGKDVLPRIPVIPGFNDSLEDAQHLAQLLKNIGAMKCQLLPFHKFGENKYDLLTQDFAYKDTPSLHPEDLYDYQMKMKQEGIDAFF